MFHRMMIHITVFLLLLTLTGCAAGGAFDTGSPGERSKSAASMDDLRNQTIALEKEKTAYQKQLADQQVEIDRMSTELADQQRKIGQMSKQATELTSALDDLTTRVKQLQDARQREHPLKEVSIAPPEKQTGKPGKKATVPKKELPKKSPPPKALEPQSKSDPEPQLKQLQEAKQKVPPRETAAAPVKKDEAKEPTKQGETNALAIKNVQKAPPVKEARESGTATIKVLAGDGKIASARMISKQLGKMGYRIKLIDLAPRSDIEATVVYYGIEHRTAAETMAKRLGGGAAATPLTWSSSFDIIVVTGRQP